MIDVRKKKYTRMLLFFTVCPRSSDPFYKVAYYIKWVTTSWTYNKTSNTLFRLNLENFIKIGEGSTGIVCIATENTSLKQVGPLAFFVSYHIVVNFMLFLVKNFIQYIYNVNSVDCTMFWKKIGEEENEILSILK